MNELILKGREDNTVPGLDMYFYSYGTMMIYRYEIIYQLTSGIWGCARYPSEHWRPWSEANLYKTIEKSNARTIVDTGCNVQKNDYNLKRILNVGTSYSRALSLGKMSKSLGDDYEFMIKLFNHEFHEYASTLDDLILYGELSISDALNDLQVKYPESRRLINILDEGILEKYYTTEYSDDDLRDDLGMIQVTMRNIEHKLVEL